MGSSMGSLQEAGCWGPLLVSGLLVGFPVPKRTVPKGTSHLKAAARGLKQHTPEAVGFGFCCLQHGRFKTQSLREP